MDGTKKRVRPGTVTAVVHNTDMPHWLDPPAGSAHHAA